MSRKLQNSNIQAQEKRIIADNLLIPSGNDATVDANGVGFYIANHPAGEEGDYYGGGPVNMAENGLVPEQGGSFTAVQAVPEPSALRVTNPQRVAGQKAGIAFRRFAAQSGGAGCVSRV